MAQAQITANASTAAPTTPPHGLWSDATLGAGLFWIFERQLVAITGHFEAMAIAADINRVHDLRRDITRLRAALRLFAEAFDPGDRDWIDSELSALARPLGQARDLDILMRRMARRHASSGESSGKAALRVAIAAAAREVAATKARTYVHGARATFLTHGLRGLISDPRNFRDWRAATAPFATEAPRLLRRLLDGLPRGDVRIDKLSAADRHGLRKQLKVLRYSLEAVRAAAGEADPSADPRLLGVLELLGDLNDAQVCHRLWKRLFGPLKLAGRGPPGPPANDKRRLKALRDAWRGFHLALLSPQDQTSLRSRHSGDDQMPQIRIS